MKSFGRRARSQPPAERVPFEFTFLRDDEPETHAFTARALRDVVGLTNTLVHAKRNPEEAMPRMLQVIARMLDNKDGTPHGWKPVPLPLQASEESAPADRDGYEQALNSHLDTVGGHVPSDGGTLAAAQESGEQERKFRGPDGNLYTFEHADAFQSFDAGSSRRRWLQLMEEEAYVSVDAQDLMELFEWLAGLAAGRPTQPSS